MLKFNTQRRKIRTLCLEKLGEHAVTSQELVRMLDYLGLYWYKSKVITDYAKNNGLAVASSDLGINRKVEDYFIPKSKIETLLEGLDILVTLSDLERAAYGLNWNGLF